MDNITKFHAKYGYIVKVDALNDKPGCIAHYPANIFMGEQPVDRTYMLYTDPYVIEIFTVVNKEQVSSNVVEAVAANIRLLVIQDIFLKAHSRGMSKELIVTKNSKTLFQMLEIPHTKEERDLETQLCVNFRELMAGNIVTSDIDGYQQVLSCFETGGL